MKTLVRRENSYEFPDTPNPGHWGQYLYFADGTVQFDAGHKQSPAIEAATSEVMGGQWAFVPCVVALADDGQWVPL